MGKLAITLLAILAAMLLGWYALAIIGAWVVLCYVFLYLEGVWQDRQFEKRRKKRGF